MLELYFLARHTPFWAIPLIILGGEFAYIFWLKKKFKTFVMCSIIAFIGLASIVFYVWVGGPTQAVKSIRRMQHYVE